MVNIIDYMVSFAIFCSSCLLIDEVKSDVVRYFHTLKIFAQWQVSTAVVISSIESSVIVVNFEITMIASTVSKLIDFRYIVSLQLHSIRFENCASKSMISQQDYQQKKIVKIQEGLKNWGLIVIKVSYQVFQNPLMQKSSLILVRLKGY